MREGKEKTRYDIKQAQYDLHVVFRDNLQYIGYEAFLAFMLVCITEKEDLEEQSDNAVSCTWHT